MIIGPNIYTSLNPELIEVRNGSIIAIGEYNEYADANSDNYGSVRVFERINNEWIQKGILLSFRINKRKIISGPYNSWNDMEHLPGKTANWTEKELEEREKALEKEIEEREKELHKEIKRPSMKIPKIKLKNTGILGIENKINDEKKQRMEYLQGYFKTNKTKSLFKEFLSDKF